MNVIIDTNIIIQENFLRSKNSDKGTAPISTHTYSMQDVMLKVSSSEKIFINISL